MSVGKGPLSGSARVSVVPVRSVGGRIQGWAVNRRGRELWFSKDRVRALNVGHECAARSFNS